MPLANPAQPVTLESVYNGIMDKLNETNVSIQHIQNTQQDLISRLDRFEKEKVVLTENQVKLQQDVDQFKEEVAIDINSVNERLTEEVRRLRKLTNLVISGIPENQDGIGLAGELMKIILPGTNLNITDDRIGKPNSIGPRLLRIRLNSQVERDTAIRNCRKLKGVDKFTKVSVRKDLT